MAREGYICRCLGSHSLAWAGRSCSWFFGWPNGQMLQLKWFARIRAAIINISYHFHDLFRVCFFFAVFFNHAAVCVMTSQWIKVCSSSCKLHCFQQETAVKQNKKWLWRLCSVIGFGERGRETPKTTTKRSDKTTVTLAVSLLQYFPVVAFPQMADYSENEKWSWLLSYKEEEILVSFLGDASSNVKKSYILIITVCLFILPPVSF